MPRWPTTRTFLEYGEQRYFAPLDGLRALSILLVMSVHLTDHMYGRWSWLRGEGGVGVFFILSGYLITTLALREERRRGSLSLKAFYVRRTLRIFPAYYFFIAVSTLVIFAIGGDFAKDSYGGALPYYLTYMGEYAPLSYFFQSWSLGIEEKFYLVWPVLCFVMVRSRSSRIAMAAAMAFLVPLAAPAWSDWNSYPRILFGCLLALLLADEKTYQRLRPWAQGWRLYFGLVAAVALHFSSPHSFGVSNTIIEPLYTIAVGLVVVGLVVAEPPWARLLASRPMRFVGSRAYGIYLVHIACTRGVESFLAPSPGNVGVTLLIFALSFLVSLLVADALYLTVERPGNLLGHRISARMLATTSAAPSGRPLGIPAQTSDRLNP